MEIQRSVTVLLAQDDDVRATLYAFRDVQQAVSPVAYNEGEPLRAVPLQRAVYHAVKGTLNSQMTITALRLVAGAYVSAMKGRTRRLAVEARRKARLLKAGKRYIERPVKPLGVCAFHRKTALFLVGSRGRDAAFKSDGTLSIWTMAGRKRIAVTVPAYAQPTLDAAKEIDSLTVIERDGRLVGRVVVTLDVAEPAGVLPVGIDRGETNALVAVDADGRELFVTGVRQKVANTRTRKTRARLQAKLATRKAQKQDTRSIRRLLQRQGRKQSRRTRDFCTVAAKRLVAWAQPGSVLVLEDLHLPQVSKQTKQRKGVRRRLGQWAHGQVEDAIRARAEMHGIAVTSVDPRYTSQD